jgi:hypothetical protein
MHPASQTLFLRFSLLAATLVAVLAGGGMYAAGLLEEAARQRPEVPDMTPPGLPDPKWRQDIAQALSALATPPSQASIDTLETTLISPKTTVGRTAARLTLLVAKGAQRLAMIDGRVYREGDTLPDGRRVHTISPQGVILEAAGALETTPWIPPLAVRLEQAAAPPAFANATLQAPANATTTTQAGKPTLNTDQALQLLRQLEALQHAR